MESVSFVANRLPVQKENFVYIEFFQNRIHSVVEPELPQNKSIRSKQQMKVYFTST